MSIIWKNGWCHVTFSVTLDGETVDFDDLSDDTKRHVAEKIVEGYKSIEINEYFEEEE